MANANGGTDANNGMASSVIVQSQSGGRGFRTPTFPAAGQPDIVRASQKDEYYTRFLNTQLLELLTRTLGKANAS